MRIDESTDAEGGRASPSIDGRRSVRLLAAARAVSFSGSFAARIALIYVIYDRTGSSAWVSAVLVADVGVLGLLGPISGWIGDHVGRRRVMIVSESAAGVAFALLIFANAPWLLVAGSLIATIVNAPFLPASTAALPNLVAPDDLRWANSMQALSSNAGLVVGPMVGGWLLAAGGIHLVFVVNAVSFVASAFVIGQVRGRFEATRTDSDDRVGGLRAGYRVIARSRIILTVTAALALAHFTFGLAMVADPALAKHFNAGPFGYAVLYTGWGAVALVGAWFAGRAVDRAQVPYRVVIGLGMVAFACLAIAVLPWFWGIVAVGSLGGIGSGALFPLTTGLIQEHSADSVRARVFGAIDTVDKSIFATGMVAGAPLVSALGAQGSYGVTAALLSVATAIMCGLPAAVRRAERPLAAEV